MVMLTIHVKEVEVKLKTLRSAQGPAYNEFGYWQYPV